MKVICHIEIEFSRTGIAPLQEHIRKFFLGKEYVPILRAVNQISGQYIYFTYSTTLMEDILKNTITVIKPYECAIKYGFRGYSSGGRNGIFYQRKQDINLIKSTEKLLRMEDHKIEISHFMQNTDEDNNLSKIKIVCHIPHRQRIVGVFDENSLKAVFLDFAKY